MDPRTPVGPADPMQGLAAFSNYYALNTGIPGAYRPRPAPLPSPRAAGANGLEVLMNGAQQLPYCGGQPVAAAPPLAAPADSEIQRYNLWRGRQERCGCGGMSLPLPKF
jgi:hypothetical protein